MYFKKFLYFIANSFFKNVKVFIVGEKKVFKLLIGYIYCSIFFNEIL